MGIIRYLLLIFIETLAVDISKVVEDRL